MQAKPLSASHLYNMLQDFRHLLIFDFRQDFQVYQIRDSFNVHPKNQESGVDKIQQVIQLAEKKAQQKQQKYKTLKKVRRYIFLDNQKLDPKDKRIINIFQVFQKQMLTTKQDKFYFLSQSMKDFYLKYPFVFIESKKFQGITDQKQREKILLYPYSKFPAQIIPGRLYLGNVYNSNSKKQLDDLGINVLFDFIDYTEDQKIPDFKHNQQKYHYFHLPFNKQVSANIDFDLINEAIQKAMIAKDEDTDRDNKIILYCKDGQTISTAFAISYLMYKAKLDVQMASIKVFQAISRVQVAKWIYTQLLVYKPKK